MRSPIFCLFETKIAFKALKNYEEQKKQGKNPIFYEDDIGITGTVWKKENTH